MSPQLTVFRNRLLIAGAALATAPLAFAQDAAATATAAAPAVAAPVAINSGDTAWMIVASALVLLMTPGLAFFYGGMARSKNVVQTIFTSFIAMGVLSILWYVCGYSLSFSTGSSIIGGLGWAMFNGVGGAANADYGATVPHAIFAAFQMMFAIITPALIAGAVIERMKFRAYVAFIILWSLVVYFPVAHMVWGTGGLIRGWGMLDFAGGLVVHQLAGFSALAAALAIGRRTDYGKADYSPSNIPLIAIGTGLLWFGWFGFNAGSAIGSNELAVSAFNVTHFGAAAAAVAWAIMDRILKGKANLTGFCVGAVVGLVAVTPAAGFVTAGGGIAIGALGAIAANLVAYARGKGNLDDSLDVFACHGVGGLVGTLLTGVFATKLVNAAGADGGMGQMMIQLKGSALGAIWSFVVTFILFKIIGAVFGLRHDRAGEEMGMDKIDHAERAYNQ